MCPIIRTAVLALAGLGTAALGLAAPAAQASVTPAATCTRTVCRVVIYEGGGDKTPVGPASLPATGRVVSTVPRQIVTSGYGKLKFDVASLEGPYGDCVSGCSEWWYQASPTAVQVTSFTYQASGKTVTGHYIGMAVTSITWKDLGNGTWTPLYLAWEASPSFTTMDCIALNTKTYTWTKAAYATSACP